MTNREWLMTLTDYELAEFIVHSLTSMWMCHNNSFKWLEQWLGEEKKDE